MIYCVTKSELINGFVYGMCSICGSKKHRADTCPKKK